MQQMIHDHESWTNIVIVNIPTFHHTMEISRKLTVRHNRKSRVFELEVIIIIIDMHPLRSHIRFRVLRRVPGPAVGVEGLKKNKNSKEQHYYNWLLLPTEQAGSSFIMENLCEIRTFEVKSRFVLTAWWFGHCLFDFSFLNWVYSSCILCWSW